MGRVLVLPLLWSAASVVDGMSLMTKKTMVPQPRTEAQLQKDWASFSKRALDVVQSHPIVQRNPYCEWFATGEATLEEQRELVRQFSVFSQHFLIAQLQKIINAPSLEEMREGKEILANEIGVVFKSPNAKKPIKTMGENAFDPEVVGIEGSVEGGVFSNRAAHFEWLLKVGEPLDLGFNDLGKKRVGSEATTYFCDELSRLYANEEDSIAIAASFAVENWAAAGFWFQLIDGFNGVNVKRRDEGKKKLPMGFWTHHAAIEQQHADHTMDELEEVYMQGRITDEDAFFEHSLGMLDAVKVFWDGLHEDKAGVWRNEA